MIDFSGYTRKSIQDEMLKQVPDNLDKRQGSIIQTAIGPVAWWLEGAYLVLDQVQKNAYVETAVGQYLDYIAAERNVVRKKATAAVRKGIFDTEIPKGSTFKTINGAQSVIFESGDYMETENGNYIYRLTCATPGMIGNAYTGSILPITAIAGLSSATIGEIVIPGTEEEDDESLRARFFDGFEAASFGGNIASYRSEILSIDGVGAVQVYPAWQGGGTVLCSILSSDLKPAESGLVAQVQEIICPPEEGESEPSANGYGIAPIGAAVTITTATNLTLDIACTIQFAAALQNGAEIYLSQIKEKIQEYLLSVCKTWGSAIKKQKVEYEVAVYSSRIVASILTIPNVINVTDVTINGAAGDLILTETAELQEIPSLGTVTING